MPPHVPGRGVVGHYFDRCITEFNVLTPGALFWFNCSQMPPHVPGRGVVGHYFDRCITYNATVVCAAVYVFKYAVVQSRMSVTVYIELACCYAVNSADY